MSWPASEPLTSRTLSATSSSRTISPNSLNLTPLSALWLKSISSALTLSSLRTEPNSSPISLTSILPLKSISLKTYSFFSPAMPAIEFRTYRSIMLLTTSLASLSLIFASTISASVAITSPHKPNVHLIIRFIAPACQTKIHNKKPTRGLSSTSRP